MCIDKRKKIIYNTKMANKKGRMIYVPPVIIDEVQDIQREDDIESRPEAFRHLVKYARVGREIKRVAKLDFSKSIKRPPVESYPNVLKPIPFDAPVKPKKRKGKNWVDDFMQGGMI